MQQNIFRPRDASKYLADHGVRRGEGTLAKDRCRGTGPRFVKIGPRDVGYKQDALDDFIAGRVSPEEFTSTSAVSEAKRIAASCESAEAR